MNLGRIGVWTRALGLMPAAQARGAVEEIEELGFSAIWYPEPVDGKEVLSHGALLLGWSERIVVASGNANIWARLRARIRSRRSFGVRGWRRGLGPEPGFNAPVGADCVALSFIGPGGLSLLDGALRPRTRCAEPRSA